MLIVAIPTLGLARRFYSEVIGRWIGAGCCASPAFDTACTARRASPSVQTIYVSNHTSTLDVISLPPSLFLYSSLFALFLTTFLQSTNGTQYQ